MRIGNDECELVTDFATLRAAMIVWVKPCRWESSHGAHRAILIGPIQIVNAKNPLGEVLPSGSGFECLPKPSCSRSHRRVLTTECVAAGVVYRVVDPKLAATTARKREAVRP